MTEDTKKISIPAFSKVAKEHFPATVTKSWFDNELVIKTILPLSDMLTFVNDVVSGCFSEDGEYIPEVKDFIIKSNILTKYGNLTLPDNLKQRYTMVYETNAVKIILANVNNMQFTAMMHSIDEKIAYLCNANIPG